MRNMKLFCRLFVLLLGFLGVVVHAQISESGTKFLQMTLLDAENEINHSKGEKPKVDFAELALRSHRLDLVALCFRNQYTRAYIYDGIKSLVDDSFRDQIVLLVLKDDAGFWPSEHPFSLNRIPVTDATLKPIESVISKYLPNVPIDAKLITTYAARTKLATDIEEAIVHLPRLEVGASKSLSQQISPIATSTTGPPMPSRPQIPLQSGTDRPEGAVPLNLKLLAILTCAILAVIAITWIAYKKRQR